jgi:RND superfamily putative drug exporter
MAAGLALAVSFGLLALVPLAPFRQLAFAIAVGIMLDVLVVRSLLMPGLLTLVGPISAWPGKLPTFDAR